MSQKKGSVFLIILLAATLIGASAVILLKNPNLIKLNKPTPSVTPTQTISPAPSVEPTFNWKTYRNEKYGFEFSFPKNLTNKEVNCGGGSLGCLYHEFFFDENDNVKLNMRIQEYDITDYLSKNRKMILAENYENKVISFESLTINQRPAIHYTIKLKPSEYYTLLTQEFLEIQIQQPKTTVVFENQNNRSPGLINQILSRFKFLDLPIQTSTPTSKPTGSGCKIGGCSGELCLDKTSEDIASICTYRENYACYKTTRCEVQVDGKCGWTQTAELKNCLAGKTNPDSQFCGGFAGVACPSGYNCQLDGNYPDAGGSCVKY